MIIIRGADQSHKQCRRKNWALGIKAYQLLSLIPCESDFNGCCDMIYNWSAFSSGKLHIGFHILTEMEDSDFCTAVCQCKRDACRSPCLISRNSAEEESSIWLGHRCWQCAVKFKSAWGAERAVPGEFSSGRVTGRSCQKELDASPIFLDAAGTVLCCCFLWQWRRGVQLEKVLSGGKNCLLQTFTCILAVTDVASFKLQIFVSHGALPGDSFMGSQRSWCWAHLKFGCYRCPLKNHTKWGAGVLVLWAGGILWHIVWKCWVTRDGWRV